MRPGATLPGFAAALVVVGSFLSLVFPICPKAVTTPRRGVVKNEKDGTCRVHRVQQWKTLLKWQRVGGEVGGFFHVTEEEMEDSPE